MKVPVWGTVSPAKGKVTVEFAGQVKSADVDAATGREFQSERKTAHEN